MTASACGAAVTRCAGCENTVGAGHPTCPRCGAADFVPSTCRKRPCAGQQRCDLHGGRAPQAKRAAVERRLEEVAGAELDRLGVEPVDNPLETLQVLAGQALAVMNYWAGKVAALGDDGVRYESKHGLEQLRSEVALHERASERAQRLVVAIGRLRIDERLVDIRDARHRRTVAELVEVLGAVIADPELGLDMAQQDRARQGGSQAHACTD